MAKSNYAPAKIDSIEPDVVSEMMNALLVMNSLGKCQTDAEVEDRIQKYFEFCSENGIRCGVETLCVALNISRQTFWNWRNGIKCSERRQKAAENAHQMIVAYLEMASLSGKLNPATSIFLLKNWANYKDNISFEASTNNDTARQLAPRRRIDSAVIEVDYVEFPSLPE